MSVSLVTVKKGEGDQRLDRWFKAHYPALGFGKLQKLMRTGQIRVNGGRVKPAHRIEEGDEIRIPPLDASDARPTEKKTARISDADAALIRGMVVHEDDALYVLNKPNGLSVQGGSKTTKHIDGMLGALNPRGDKPKLVHRIDRDTSGLLVIAKTAEAARALTHAFKARDAHKLYWAITIGVPEQDSGEIDAALAKRGGPGQERVELVDRDHPMGKPARTEFELLDRAGNKAAFMALSPLTGRTHQLRVHLASLGTPIQGDGKYGERVNFIQGLKPVLHLHARGLDIAHPNGGRLQITAPLEGAMAETFRFFGFDMDAPNPFKDGP